MWLEKEKIGRPTKKGGAIERGRMFMSLIIVKLFLLNELLYAKGVSIFHKLWLESKCFPSLDVYNERSRVIARLQAGQHFKSASIMIISWLKHFSLHLSFSLSLLDWTRPFFYFFSYLRSVSPILSLASSLSRT